MKECDSVISTVNAEFTPPTECSLSLLARAVAIVYYADKMCFQTCTTPSFVHCQKALAPPSAQLSPHIHHVLSLSLSPRLESQMMSDIQAILQLLQRQSTLGPPAYSTVTGSPDYHRPAVKVQPVALTASHHFSHTATHVRRLTHFIQLIHILLLCFVARWFGFATVSARMFRQ